MNTEAIRSRILNGDLRLDRFSSGDRDLYAEYISSKPKEYKLICDQIISEFSLNKSDPLFAFLWIMSVVIDLEISGFRESQEKIAAKKEEDFGVLAAALQKVLADRERLATVAARQDEREGRLRAALDAAAVRELELAKLVTAAAERETQMQRALEQGSSWLRWLPVMLGGMAMGASLVVTWPL